MARTRQVSTSRTIAADRRRIFDVLADPAMHPRIDGSGTVRDVQDGGPDRLELGVKFGMDMKLGTSYRILNTVVEFEEGERIAWRHFHGHRWRYELRDVEGGTEVTETFDWSTARTRWTLELAGIPKRNLEGMRRTLERLETLVTTG
ncbi:dimethyladenosine transferase [Nitriliruptoraceae bacterium ZYF776]|nr:dimethyladenosine transferase [Profundirhabdus halotolerans]